MLYSELKKGEQLTKQLNCKDNSEIGATLGVEMA